MAGRVVMFLQRGSFEPAYQAASLAVTAAAMGDEVLLVLSFEALRAVARDAFGLPHSDREIAENARGDGLGVPPPKSLLLEARSLGARVVVCDTTLKLCGLSAAELGTRIDEVMGLPTIWRLSQGARVLSI